MSDFVHDSLSSIIDRHKVLICVTLVALIMLGVVATNVFSVLAFIAFVLIVIFAKEQFLMCLLLFMLPFASLFKLAPETFSLFTICEILVVIRVFCTKKVSVSVIIAGLVYFGYLVLGTYVRGQAVDVEHIKQFENIFMLYCLVLMSKDTPFEKIATYYILGMVFSSVVGLYAQGKPIFYQYAKHIDLESDGYTRFCGLMGDPNYYSVNTILAFVMLLALRKKGKIKVDMFWVLYAVLTLFGFLTVSKSFMLMYIVIFTVTAVIVVKEKNPIENCLLVLGVVIILIFGLSNGGLISSILERITSSTNMNELTTGRSDIWERYLELIMSDPGVMVFGTGLTNHLLNRQGTHNIYIESIYYLGLVGLFLLIMCLYFCFKTNKKREGKTKFNRLGWISLAIMYFFLQSLFSYVLIYNFFIAYIIHNEKMGKEIIK